jgi:hypothetical protein
MTKYNLGFISDDDIFQHVKVTVMKYRFRIGLAEFNSNLIDPIKLTFDSKVYKKDIEDVLESEIIRQLDKSNTNHIGYFHQNIFKFTGNDWVVPKEGYDIINESKNIYVEMKNKHNTMNSSSAKNTYMRMQDTLIKNPNATCMLVEVIASNSQDIKWSVSIDKNRVSHERIRRVSIDKFYEIVTGDKSAFKKLCNALPKIIEDVVESVKLTEKLNTVVDELREIDNNLLKSIYLLSFRKYEGFHDFNI